MFSTTHTRRVTHYTSFTSDNYITTCINIKTLTKKIYMLYIFSKNYNILIYLYNVGSPVDNNKIERTCILYVKME